MSVEPYAPERPDIDPDAQRRDFFSGLEPGHYPDLAEADYHADPAMSSTLVRKLSKSIDHYHHELDKDGEQSDAMRLGSLVHLAVLEPERFQRDYVDAQPPERPGDKSWKGKHLETAALVADGLDFEAIAQTHSKGYQASTYEKYASKDGFEQLVDHYDEYDYDPETSVDSSTLDNVRRVRDSVLNHPRMRGGLLAGDRSEESFVWEHPLHPIRCRLRTDHIQKFGGGLLVADLKTTGRSVGYWERQLFWRRRYHQQAAWYIDGIERVTGECVAHFVFVVVETNPPYSIKTYDLPESAIEAGRASNADALDDLVSYWRDPDIYTGLDPDIQELEPPKWVTQ